MAKKRKHLGEILFRAGLVDKQALINAIKTAKAKNRRLGQVLLELGLIDEETLSIKIGGCADDLDRIFVGANRTI